MILIGQYDSPFVRRVGIALTLYGLPFEHRPWSSFGDTEKIRAYNPLTRVPTLVLEDGLALIESHSMLDHLDRVVGPDRAMFPVAGRERDLALRIAALATGLGDKVVSLFYERRLHASVSPLWIERCTTQIQATARVLEAERAQVRGDYWSGPRIGHADIALAVVLRFVNEVHRGLLPMDEFPALRSHAAHHEALPVFQAVAQAFVPPA